MTHLRVQAGIFDDLKEKEGRELTFEPRYLNASVVPFCFDRMRICSNLNSTNEEEDTDAEFMTRQRVRAGMFDAIEQKVGDDTEQTTDELEQVLQVTASISGTSYFGHLSPPDDLI